MAGPQNRFRCSGKEKQIQNPAGIRVPVVQPIAYTKLATAPPPPPWFLVYHKVSKRVWERNRHYFTTCGPQILKILLTLFTLSQKVDKKLGWLNTVNDFYKELTIKDHTLLAPGNIA
jgi:hypothetical protein